MDAGPAPCAHCGEPLPATPVHALVDGRPLAFCCHGCAAAAQWIRAAHLEDYYRLRSEAAGRVGDALPDYAAWDRADVLAEHAHARADGSREITVLSDGMRCAACAWLIDKALRREPGVDDVSANAVTGRIRIAWRPAQAPLSRLLSRLAALGYRPYLAAGEAREAARRRERNRWLLRLGIAGLGAMQAMMFAEALYLDTAGQMPLPTRDFFRWITFLVSTPVVFYAGWPFLEGALRELRARRLGMDALIAGSTLLAYFASVAETVRGGVHVWYDAAVMFVFLLLAARMLEQRARATASAQVDALARARPALATRERGGGGSEQVPLAELRAGDVVRVADGEALPADGTLLAAAALDEALLTGESQAVHRQPGDAAFAGSLCRGQPLRLRVERVGSDTRLSELTRLVERAQAGKPRLARVADRVAGGFVAALLLCAAAVHAWWRMHDPARALEVTLAVLVVSCPCALSLAIPAALAAAHGALSRLGVLSLRGDALDTLARVDAMLLDKTGTLTDGRNSLGEVRTFDGFPRAQALAIAAALQRDGTHPMARAFAGSATDLQATDVANTVAQGVQGRVDGRPWRLGRAAFAAADHADDGALWLGDGARAVARLEVRESMRNDAPAAIAALHRLGIATELASGDAPERADAIARAAGIDAARGRRTPEDKLARARELQAQGRVVAMLGDGINDAPVLAGADVSLAMADGTALAQRAADFVVVSPSLLRVPQAIALARRTRRIVRQNLAWAIGYNVIALPLAASGQVTPWMAALGMAASSLLVTLNALRLSRTPVRESAA